MTRLSDSNPSKRLEALLVELRALLKTALEVADEIGAGEPDGPEPIDSLTRWR